MLAGAKVIAMPNLEILFSDLIRFETEIWNAIDARMRSEFDLPMSRFEPMQVIARTENCRVYDIAGELGITVGGTSKLVDRIEASGYCVRRTNPEDRRSSIIELTPSGKEVFERASGVFNEELSRRIGSVASERALKEFASLLGRLRAANSRDFVTGETGVI
jgi:DNA-binding MarR family transcriptional regulator